MALRIAFTVHKFPPDSLGGTEIYSWSLALALSRRGHSVHVFYPVAGVSEDERRVTREGVRLWRSPAAAASDVGNPATQYWRTFRDKAIEDDFERFLSEARPDIIHFQHVQGVSARLIGLAAPLPRVLTLHDYWYFCANSQLIRPDQAVCAGPRFGWNCVDCATARADLQRLRPLRPLIALPFAYRNAYLRRQLDEIDAFIAPSHFLRAQYVNHGLPGDRIRVLENGVDLERLNSSSGAGIPPPLVRPHFAFLGSLAWQKGAHVLIAAFNRLGADASLTVYGSEHTFPEYARSLRAAATHPHVRFAGALDPRDVGVALRDVDCLIVPSVWYENSPLVIQEALAMGVPVVASRLGALEEKVEEGVTGCLFAAGDDADLAATLATLISHPEKLAAFKRNIRPPVTMAEHVGLVEALYAQLGQRPGH